MSRATIGITAMVCATALLISHWSATAGPLDPPAEAVDGNGAPVSTQPTLAELEAKIDALGASAGGIAGPWEVATVSIAPTTSDVLNSIEIAPGRVLVHQIAVDEARATLFDGVGSVDVSGRVLVGEAIASARNDAYSVGEGGTGDISTVTVSLDVVVENGLHWTYRSNGSDGYVYVYYRALDE